jgi:enamine deaminase RidA (YjgF/YER057c/UK114 family)
MKILNPESLPAPRGYSNGILLPVGKILFIAGQIGWDSSGKLAGDLTSQFAQALQNVLAVLSAAGGEVEQIGKLTIFIKDKGDYIYRRKEIGKVYRQLMGKHFPAMSLVVVKDLLEEDAQVEIEATAVIP